MIRLGAPVFDAPVDPYELAMFHRKQGYTAAYVPKTFEAGDEPTLRAFRDGFARANVMLAEVGAWGNLLAGGEEGKRNQEYVVRRLDLAEELGARCCVDYLGTMEPGSKFGPNAGNISAAGFEQSVAIVRDIVDAVRPRRTRFCLEFMSWCLPDSVDSALAMIGAVDRPGFAIHLDPVNLVQSPRAYYDTGALIRDAFARLGKWIVSCHAKDVIAREGVILHIDEVAPGQGKLDYRVFTTELTKLGREVPLMLEHLKSAQEYAAARDYVIATGTAAGAQFVK